MKLTTFIVTSLISFIGFSQSDEPCTATPIVPGTSCSYSTYTNAGATASEILDPTIPAPGCASYNGQDVWFSVIVPASGNLEFDASPVGFTDGGMAIYSGTCNALVLIECDDDDSPNGLMPAISATGLTPGSTIWVRFWRYGTGAGGTFDFCVYELLPLANDDPCTATSLTVGTTCTFNTFTTQNATASEVLDPTIPAPGCGNYQGGDVWFTAVVPASGKLIIDSDNQVLSSCGMAIYSGTCGALSLIQCDWASSANGSMPFISATGLTPGATIWIRFWDYANNLQGTFDICVFDPLPPVNNNPCTATSVTVGGTCSFTTYTTEYATASEVLDPTIPAPGCANYLGGDVWFSVVVPASGALVIDTDNQDVSSGGLAIYSGTCGALNLIECDYAGSVNGSMPYIFAGGLTPGSTIWIRFWEYGNNVEGTFDFCVFDPPVPVNDNPCTATSLSVGTSCSFTTFTTEYATTSEVLDPTIPDPGCANYQGGDVWFTAVVPASGNLVIDTDNQVLSSCGMAIYSGTCSALSLIECDYAGSTNGNMPYIYNEGLTPGATIWIRFWDYSNNLQGTFDICVYDPPVPVNDDPCAAIPVTVGTSCSFATYTNEYATSSEILDPSIPSPNCAYYQGGDVWFTFIVPASGTVAIDSDVGVLTDGGMAVYTGTCSSLTLVGCDSDNSLNGAMPYFVPTNLTPGSTVWVRLWEYGNNNNGTFDLCIYEPTPPSNDDPCSATPITVGTDCNLITYSNVGATASELNDPSIPAPNCASYQGSDVWFTLTVPASGNIGLDSDLGFFNDGGMAIYTGPCSALSLIECDDFDSYNGSMPYIFSTGLTPGSTLWIRFWEDGNNEAGEFELCAYDPDACGYPANNDFCQNPVYIYEGGSVLTGETAASYSNDLPGNLSSVFCGSIENNSWYAFTATNDTAVFNFATVTGCSSGIQALVLDVTPDANGCCADFTLMSNCFNPATSAPGVVTATNLIIGNEYILMVDGYAGSNCDFTVTNWGPTILPVELISFQGEANGDQNDLTWITASENNCSHFEIQRSENALDFVKIGEVLGAGNSISSNNYSFSDQLFTEELEYYRLKQVDFDGKVDYSDIITILNDHFPTPLRTSPNPFSNSVSVYCTSEVVCEVEITVLSPLGKVVYAEQVGLVTGKNKLELNLSGLQSGSYLICIQGDNFVKEMIKTIKL